MNNNKKKTASKSYTTLAKGREQNESKYSQHKPS